MSSLEEIFMPDDVGQAIEDSNQEPANAAQTSTDEFSFDDLFDSNSTESLATEAEAEPPIHAAEAESFEMEEQEEEVVVAQETEVSDQGGEASEPVDATVIISEVGKGMSSSDLDKAGMAFDRVLALSKYIRELRVYLKSQQEEVKETKKCIEDAMERMLIITEELGMQIEGGLSDEPAQEPTEAPTDPEQPVEEPKAETEQIAETEVASSEEVTPPGPNRRPKTVIVIKDVKDGEDHLFSKGEVVEVADVCDNGGLWVYQGPSDTSESVQIEQDEYEVDTWSEIPSDPDDEWEDVPDDELQDDGSLTWEKLGCTTANIASLIDIEIKEPSDLVGKTIEDLTKANGIGPKKAAKILSVLEGLLEPE